MLIAYQTTDGGQITSVVSWDSSITDAFHCPQIRTEDTGAFSIGGMSIVNGDGKLDAGYGAPIDLKRAANDNKAAGQGLIGAVKRSIRRFAKDEDAAITVAFVLWVPVFVSILALTVDATVLFISQANMWSVARDTSRFMAVGLYSNADAEAYAAAQLPIWGEQSTIVASRNANFVTINLSVPISDVAPFNISGIFTDGFLVAELSQRLEPN